MRKRSAFPWLVSWLVWLSIASLVPVSAQEPQKTEPRKAEEAIKPLPPIPDDPPPHEGAMIQRPIIVQPPDVLQIEVIEAMPGRPISGERLVRPDGTISLGFYGNLSVVGLTTDQIKVKLIHHLRTYLTDDSLGLVKAVVGDDLIPELPKPGTVVSGPFRDVAPVTPTPSSPPGAAPQPAARSPFEVDKLVPTPTPEKKQAADGEEKPAPKVEIPAEPAGLEMKIRYIDPVDSNRVWVDIISYNSHTYYVQGDVGTPGRMPFTGRETVLDALNYAGGLIPTAESFDIHLYRPAQGGKPTKDYRIDHAAILKGDATANLQLFAGDRLVVGRNPIVQKTIEIDRAGALTSSAINTMLQYSFTARAMESLNEPPANSLQIKLGGQKINVTLAEATPMTPAARDAQIRQWVDFLWSAASKETGANLDEKAFREALMKRLAPAAIMPPGTK